LIVSFDFLWLIGVCHPDFSSSGNLPLGDNCLVGISILPPLCLLRS
jgi:hypothetical protein